MIAVFPVCYLKAVIYPCITHRPPLEQELVHLPVGLNHLYVFTIPDYHVLVLLSLENCRIVF
jgi:hypothetical protein